MEALDPIERYKIIREEYRKGDHVLLWVTILPYINWYARLKKGTLKRKDFRISIQIITQKYPFYDGDNIEFYTLTIPKIKGFSEMIFKTEEEARAFCQEEYLKFLAGVKND